MKITIIGFLWGFHLTLVIVNKGVESAKSDNVLMVNLTLVQGAEAKGAVCLDGSLPGYHLHRGHGTGANSWLILLQGGGWCANIQACVNRKITSLGSSKFMEKQLPFMGILSDKAEENPDFFNWNRVKFRYCDGASFSGEGQDEAANLMFRGQRIWIAGIEDLLSSGMREADQAFLSGCSAGGVATIIHCDEFRSLFPERTKVKCLSDAGLFLDVADVSGMRVLKYLFHGVVSMQGVGKNLPKACLEHMSTTLCFFPQYLVDNIRTPLFLVNSAYDTWQIHVSLVPPFSDRNGDWNACKSNQTNCSPSQMQFLQDFKRQMLDSVESFSMQRKNGLFIDSWFAHCQTETQETWFSKQAPLIGGKGIAQTVGDWYFDRSMQVKETYRSNESNSSTKPTVTSNSGSVILLCFLSNIAITIILQFTLFEIV